MLEGENSKNRPKVERWFIASAAAFSLFQFVGGDLFDLSKNYNCFKYLGCNVGFFGYDVIVHFFGGLMEAMFLVWLMEKYPKFNILSKSFLKNAIIIIAVCVLIGVVWEMYEFGYDHFRMDVLHEDIVQKNQLLQPTNSDTMGDLTFGLLGAASALALIKFFNISSEKWI